MKTKLLTISRSLKVFAIIALALVCASCDKTETTDSTGFILHYYGVTDIGPSMAYTLEAPTYKGSAPYDFTITGITLNDEACTTESFVIDAETGAINIQNTENLATGLYAISVGCYSNGKYFEFKDAVQINMLLAVPEGVTVTPAEVVVKMEDKKWWEAGAQVTTDTEKHVSITGYSIAEDESKEYLKYFTISNDGIITFNPDKKDNIIPGEKYVISLKLKTKAGEHLYADAVTFNVISKPLNLLYTPNEVRVERMTAHESELPTIQGSLEGRTYAIKSITPEISGFTIDATTGKITIAENVLTTIGNIYKVDVTVTNEYGNADFPEAYIVTVVDFIAPIVPEKFKYEIPETYEGKGYAIPLADGFIGDEVIFDFSDNEGAIKDQIEKKRISIDKVSGSITIAENNTLAPNDYTVKVKATNPKGEVTISFPLVIKANPNKFTFHYGNNLGLTPVENYASQYEIENLNELKALDLQPKTDLNGRSATWKIMVKRVQGAKEQLEGTTINNKTGKIDFSNAKLQSKTPGVCIGMLVVEATVGEGDLAYTVTAPVFIRYNSVKDASIVKYKPFAIRVNPRTGGRSAAPETITPENLIIDFRANFNYFDINTTTSSGFKPDAKEGDATNNIMKYLWKNFYETTGVKNGVPNYGAKKPMSALDTSDNFDNTKNLNMTLGYINQVDRSIVINPDMWKNASGEYLDGVLIPQVVYSTDGTDNKDKRFMPVAIWFDENF